MIGPFKYTLYSSHYWLNLYYIRYQLPLYDWILTIIRELDTNMIGPFKYTLYSSHYWLNLYYIRYQLPLYRLTYTLTIPYQLPYLPYCYLPMT